jgi:hypothetical protein
VLLLALAIIMVPVGAIIYLIMRKKLFAAASIPTVETSLEAAPAEPTPENAEKPANESADAPMPSDGDQAED